MIIDPGFEARTTEQARRFTDDIAECEAAEISIVYQMGDPFLRFVFGDKRLRGRPALGVQLTIRSRRDLFGTGRLLAGDELKRLVRERIEQYFKLEGIALSKKAFQNAHL